MKAKVINDENKYIWDDDNLIKLRCLNCFRMYPILKIFDISSFLIDCNYCSSRYKIDSIDYLKFIKNNIEIPLCFECHQNNATYTKKRLSSSLYSQYYCNNCLNQYEMDNYMHLMHNFNDTYCKKHNLPFIITNYNNSLSFCKICYDNLPERDIYKDVCHAYPVLFDKIRNNLELFKKDKEYLENLILKLKENHPELKEESNENYKDDEYTNDKFEYFIQNFFTNLNSLIEMITIILQNYHPAKLQPNLSKTLEYFLSFKKINEFNFKEFEKKDLSKKKYIIDYLNEYDPFVNKAHPEIDKKKLCEKINEIDNCEGLYGFEVLKDGRIAAFLREKDKESIVIFKLEDKVKSIEYDIIYKIGEKDELSKHYKKGIIGLDNGNILVNNISEIFIFKLDNYNKALIKIKEFNQDYEISRIIKLTKNRIGIEVGIFNKSYIIFNYETMEKHLLHLKEEVRSSCKLLNKEILVLSILGENSLDFWSLENYTLICRIHNIGNGLISNYKENKIILETDEFIYYVINTKNFKVENVFGRIKPRFEHCYYMNYEASIWNNCLITCNIIVLFNVDFENLKYYEMPDYFAYYQILPKKDMIILYEYLADNNKLFFMKKNDFFNLLNEK